MSSLTVRQSLGGRWSSNLALAAGLFVPTSALVAMQESLTPFPSLWFVVASALIQHTIATAVTIGGIAAVRLCWAGSVLPLPAVFIVWAASGVARGAFSGWFAEAGADAQPEYGYRVLFWTAAAVTWVPLSVYSAAQIDLRLQTLGELAALRANLAAELLRTAQSSRRQEADLLAAIEEAVTPIISDIAVGLSQSLRADGTSLAGVGSRLEGVKDRIGSMLDAERESMQKESLHQPEKAPVVSALTLEGTRPFIVSIVMAIASLAVVVPDALRFAGPAAASDGALAIVAGTASIFSLLTLQRSRGREAHPVSILAIFAASSLVSAIAYLWTKDLPLSAHELILLVTVPVGLMAAGMSVTIAIGLHRTNGTLLRRLHEQEAQLVSRTTDRLDRQDRSRRQITSLLHGPILGRLSACLMAINFLPADASPEARSTIAQRVMDHLDLINADLTRLAEVSLAGVKN